MSQLKLFLLASVFMPLAACGTSPDERPATFEVVSLEVLAPACGQGQCHSTATWTQGFAFDTLEASKESLNYGLVAKGKADSSALIQVIRGQDYDRMPPDVPFPEQDLELCIKWINAGAPGL